MVKPIVPKFLSFFIYFCNICLITLQNKIDQAKGAVKEGLGKVSGDKKTEFEGAVEKVAAKVKEVGESVKESVEGAAEGLKNAVSKDK